MHLLQLLSRRLDRKSIPENPTLSDGLHPLGKLSFASLTLGWQFATRARERSYASARQLA